VAAGDAVGCGDDGEGEAVDATDGDAVALGEGEVDAELAAGEADDDDGEIDGEGDGVAVGQMAPGKIWKSWLTVLPGRFCCAYSTGAAMASAIAWSVCNAGSATFPRLGGYPGVPGGGVVELKHEKGSLTLALVTPG
jgi:hypothetical protein